MSHTLLLNADVQPVSLLPLSTIPWQDTMRLVMQEKVTVLEYYEDWEINTVNNSFKIPSVVMVKRYVNRKSKIALTRSNIYLRDNYQCQYCSDKFIHSELTYDHMIPRSLGGQTTWENIVSACKPCNSRKGSKLIKPNKMPFVPTYWNLIKNRAQVPILIKHHSWEKFLDPKMRVKLIEGSRL